MPRCTAVLSLPVLAALLIIPSVAAAQIDLSACRYLPRYRPAPDVDYTPGVDVRGRPVAPADLPGSAGAAPRLERFDIPLTLDLARRLRIAVPSNGLPGNAEVGLLTLSGNRLYLNGQPIGGQSEAEFYALCRSAR